MPALPPEASKLNGVPYLEDESHWPRDARGEPFPFVGQINFAELPRVDSKAPEKGIFVMFSTAGEQEPHYIWRWYPNPTERPVSRPGPCAGRFEIRLRASPAVSVSFASWWGSDFFESDLEKILEWDVKVGGNLASWTVATLPSGDPREWFGLLAESPSGPDDGEQWIQLWDQRFEESYGSLTYVIATRRTDFEAGRLDRCAVVAWQ